MEPDNEAHEQTSDSIVYMSQEQVEQGIAEYSRVLEACEAALSPEEYEANELIEKLQKQLDYFIAARARANTEKLLRTHYNPNTAHRN